MAPFATTPALTLPELMWFPVRVWRRAMVRRRTEPRSANAVSHPIPTGAATSGHDSAGRVLSHAAPAPGLTEIRVDGTSAFFSQDTLSKTAASIGLSPGDIDWIAAVGAACDDGIGVTRLNLYRPRTARESIWAIEQALNSTGASTIAAWLPLADADRRRSERRLLRRLREMAWRHGKSLVLLRFGESLDSTESARDE